MSDIEIEWEASDGYVGGKRPQHLTVSIDEFENCSTQTEVESLLDEIIHEDFREKVIWEVGDYEGIVSQILEALPRIKPNVCSEIDEQPA